MHAFNRIISICIMCMMLFLLGHYEQDAQTYAKWGVECKWYHNRLSTGNSSGFQVLNLFRLSGTKANSLHSYYCQLHLPIALYNHLNCRASNRTNSSVIIRNYTVMYGPTKLRRQYGYRMWWCTGEMHVYVFIS